WMKNSVPMTDGGNVSGTTNATLTLNNVALADAATYSVVVTNAYGALTSAPATLTIATTARSDSFTMLQNGQLSLFPGQLLANDVAGSLNGANSNLTFVSISSNSVSGGTVRPTTLIGQSWLKTYIPAGHVGYSYATAVATDTGSNVVVTGSSSTSNDVGIST